MRSSIEPTAPRHYHSIIRRYYYILTVASLRKFQKGYSTYKSVETKGLGLVYSRKALAYSADVLFVLFKVRRGLPVAQLSAKHRLNVHVRSSTT